MIDNEIKIRMVDNGYIIESRFRYTKLPEYVEMKQAEASRRIREIFAEFAKLQTKATKQEKDFDAIIAKK